MPLSLFDYGNLRHYRSTYQSGGEFEHSFGGAAEAYGWRFVGVDEPFHVLYRLDLSDPRIPVEIEGVRYLPLVYGFHYAAYDGDFTYRVNGAEIEIVEPAKLDFDPDFPYPGHPQAFPFWPIALERAPYDPRVAEDALSLQAIFGLDHLSPAQLKRAIQIGLADNSCVSFTNESQAAHGWTDEQVLRLEGRRPFMQGAPLAECRNPRCRASISHRCEERNIEFPPELADLVPDGKVIVEARDVRVDTLRVLAIHTPPPDDNVEWGDSYMQLIFQICDLCQAIRVTNQCT